MYHFSNFLKDPDAPKVNNPAADGDNSTAVQIVENNTGDGDNAANDKSKDAEGAKDAEEGKFTYLAFFLHFGRHFRKPLKGCRITVQYMLKLVLNCR